jgi:hypothetical protein
MIEEEPIDLRTERRCANGRPCVEVTARLTAADLAEYVHGNKAAADQLRDRARLWAAAHGYGRPAELEEGAA